MLQKEERVECCHTHLALQNTEKSGSWKKRGKEKRGEGKKDKKRRWKTKRRNQRTKEKSKTK